MRNLSARILIAVAILTIAPSAMAQWVTFANETSTRLSASSTLGSGDVQEKDYAWADFDQDGDTDLVSVRKQPFTSTGRHPNVLFMNVNGVLTDQTALYASASNVAGSQGMLDLTNDRDVVAVDVDGDGWLDLVTATTLSGTQPKYISHPRVYINLGNDGGGNWQGFIFDDQNRFPTMPAEPRFCAVSAGDIDGDGDEDIYMGDYQQGGPRPIDLNDRLFINDGNGYFTDESSTRMSVVMLESSFAMSTAIADMNGDGKLDIIKDDALNAPQGVSVSYNDTATEGFFGSYDIAHSFAPYHVAVGELNNDGKLDMVVSDDGSDRFALNTGNSGGIAQFTAQTFSFSGGGSDDGFASNNLIVDLDNNGWNDVIICDVDVDISGCGRRTHIYRNLGPTGSNINGVPNVTLQEQQVSGAISGIPTSMLVGTHDIAAMDINGDGWLDLVIGRCTGTQVWMSQPPTGLTFSYPTGLPAFINPGDTQTIQVQVNTIGGTITNSSTATLYQSINGGAYSSSPMTHLGGNLYEGTLTAPASCGEDLEFYVSIDDSGGTTFSDPATAPTNSYTIVAAAGTAITFEDDFEGAPMGWTVNNTAITTGGWERAIPNPTFSGSVAVAPGDDAQSAASDWCYVTQNGSPTSTSAGAADVDGGPTDLITPVIDLAGTDANISYARWFYCNDTGPTDADYLNVAITGDGSNWVVVENVTGILNEWTVVTFRVSDYITPTANVQVRFRVSDNPNNSVTEAGIDTFKVEEFLCPTTVCQPSIGFQGPGPLTLNVCGGDLSQGTVANVQVTNAMPNNFVFILVDTAISPAPVLNGTAITTTPLLVVQVVTNGAGEWTSANVPGGIGNFTYYLQAAEFRNDVPGGLGFSNGVQVNFLP